MRTFKDLKDRDWELSVTLGLALRVKGKLGVDLLQPEEGNGLGRLVADDALLAQVIVEAIEPQMEGRGLNAADVAESFDGAVLCAAQAAFMEEYADFFRSRGRSDRALAVEKMRESLGLASEAARSRIETLDLKGRIDGAMSGD